MKYSEAYERDFEWYVDMFGVFDFAGTDSFFKKEVVMYRSYKGADFIEFNRMSLATFASAYPQMVLPNGIVGSSKGSFCDYRFDLEVTDCIQEDCNGVSSKEAFYRFDTLGEVVSCWDVATLRMLYVTKASVNLHIKMYAQDRANGRLPKVIFDEMCDEFKAPEWFREAVENQKLKYYNENNS